MTMNSALRKPLGDGIVWDNHACMPLRSNDLSFLLQLEQIKRTGVDVMTLNVAYGKQDTRSALAMLSTFRAWVPSTFRPIQ